MKIEEKSYTQKQELPWFIHKFREEYIMLFRDFKFITGIELSGNYTAEKREYRLVGGRDYNGWGWHTVIDKENFKEEYGFEYGDDNCMMYLYLGGIKKALRIGKNEISCEAKKIIEEGILKTERKIYKPAQGIGIMKTLTMPSIMELVGVAFVTGMEVARQLEKSEI